MNDHIEEYTGRTYYVESNLEFRADGFPMPPHAPRLNRIGNSSVGLAFFLTSSSDVCGSGGCPVMAWGREVREMSQVG